MTHARASKIVLASLAALVASCAGAPATVPPPSPPPANTVATIAPPEPPKPKPRTSDRFAVASENATAVEVARQILERGGSAVDATIAGVLVGCAAHPSSCGLGGGGVALVWDPKTAKASVVDFREMAPSGIRRADHLGKATPKDKRGVMVGVPGFAAGLAELHRHGGKLSFADDVNAAADAIDKGVPVSPYMAQALAWSTKWIADDERARALFGGADPESRVGDTLKSPALVATLRKLASSGADAFYRGEVAADVVDSARAAKSRMTLADVAAYRAIVREPLSTDWQGTTLLTAPAPFAGGFVALETAAVLGPSDLAGEWGSPALIHTQAEAARLANQDRVQLVGDPEFTKADVEPLLDPAALAGRRAKIRADASTMPKLPSISEGGSYHFVAVDEDGGVVSLTATLTSLFGAKIVTKSGFVL
ncbi:MAG TPA: gamma-glutamyltransferase, partial [Polyangiaceae bacterium]|nr:gamma-glutamyltransferase [Polyangiaceae bacterium]